MKKLFSVLLIMVLAFSLVACGKKEEVFSYSSIYDDNGFFKNIKISDYNDILQSLQAINLDQVFKENEENIGLDGWTLSCSISHGVIHHEIAIWNPEKDALKTETTKFLQACDKVFALLD